MEENSHRRNCQITGRSEVKKLQETGSDGNILLMPYTSHKETQEIGLNMISPEELEEKKTQARWHQKVFLKDPQ